MKINKNTRKDNLVSIEAEEDFSQFEAAVEKEISKAMREMHLPGFRPGKAPRDIVEKNLNRDAIESHAAQELISDLYPKIIDEAEISPVDYPKIDILKFEKGKPFVFKLEVEVYPEVKLGKYTGIKVEKEKKEVTEEHVLKVLGNLQERYSIVTPEGKKEVHPLDDEFAKKVSQHGSMAELKAEITDAMQKDRIAQSDAEVRNKLVAAVSSEIKVDIPKAMVSREVEIMLDEFRSSLAQSGLALEDYLKGIKKEESAMKEELSKSAEIRVKGKLALQAVADKEEIKVTDQDIEEELQAAADQAHKSLAEIKKTLQPGSLDYISDYLLRRKALDFLVEKAKIVEVEASSEEPKEETKIEEVETKE
ncbi:MAG: trigger factor [Candidatus Margulisiibacteriota bacterium]